MQPTSYTPPDDTDPTKTKGDKTRNGEVTLPPSPEPAPLPEPKK